MKAHLLICKKHLGERLFTTYPQQKILGLSCMVKRYHTQKEGSTYIESDHTTTYGGKGTDNNKLDTLLGFVVTKSPILIKL